MRRTFALLIALCASAAIADDGISVTRGDLLKRRQYVTAGALTYYVETTGNDANACTDVSAPCLTIDGALGKIPKEIAHPTNVQVGLGNFGAFTMTGFRIRSPSSTTGTANYLAVTGTLTTPTLAQGPTSGTLTAATAASGATFATYTDGAANWAVNALQGYLLEIISGTGSTVQPTAGIIVANTATVITALGPTAANGSGYAIRDWGSFVTTPATATSNGPPGASTSTEFTYCARIQNNTGAANNPLIYVTRMGFKPTCTSVLNVRGSNRVSLTTIKTDDTGGSAQFGLSANDGSGVTISGYYCIAQTTGVCFGNTSTNIQSTGVGITRSWFRGGNSSVTLAGPATLTTSYFTGANFCNLCLGGQSAGASVQIVGIRIDGGARGLYLNNSSAGGAMGNWGCTSADISNTTVAGITMATHLTTGNINTVSGTGNLVGIALSEGAHLNIKSGVTITGTTELTLDGNAYTLAGMRANTPRSIMTPIGTCAYE